MAQTINTQVRALKAQKFLESSREQMSDSMKRIGSGSRINGAKDDAAGLAIAERMNSLVRGMNVGIRNANDGISMARVAEGGLRQVNELLQRMRELAMQSSNGTYTASDRENLNAEFTALNEEVSRVAATTTFNGETVLAGGGGSVSYQVGPNTAGGDSVQIDLVDVAPLSADISTREASLTSIDQIDAMISEISGYQARFGAVQNRFESTISNLQTGVENQTAARGRIVDADYAVETALLARSQILQNSSLAMSAQANVSAQSVRQLLG